MEGNFPAMKVADSQTNDGRKMTFLIPHDAAPSNLILAPIGTKLMIAYAQYTEAEEAPEVEQPAPEKPDKRRFEDMPASQQAGLRCGETPFQEWFAETYRDVWREAVERLEARGIGLNGMTLDLVCAEAVRLFCGVESRADLDVNVRNGPNRGLTPREKWLALDERFRIDTGKEPWRP